MKCLLPLFLASAGLDAPTTFAFAFDASASSRREVLAKVGQGLASGAGVLGTGSGLLVPSSPALAAPEPDASPLVGIIGGIGPLADVRLAELIVDLDNERCSASKSSKGSGFTSDACHTSYLLYSNPRHIPNNNLASLGLGPPSVDALVDSAKVLTKAGANVIATACTAAHSWRDEVEERVNTSLEGNEIEVMNVLELTAEAVGRDGHTAVGLVEVDGTIKAGLFEEAMKQHGIEPILPDASDQLQIMETVADVKRGGVATEELRKRLYGVVRNMVDTDESVTAIVFGCTDIAAIMGGHVGGIDDEQMSGRRPIEYYDTLQVLAEEVVRISNAGVTTQDESTRTFLPPLPVRKMISQERPFSAVNIASN